MDKKADKKKIMSKADKKKVIEGYDSDDSGDDPSFKTKKGEVLFPISVSATHIVTTILTS